MEPDSFTPVAITYSQPEAAVMLSMFEFYGIPAYAVGARHAGTMWPMVVALGGVEIRVASAMVEEAHALLAPVMAQPPVVRPPVVEGWFARLIANTLGWIMGAPPPPRVATDYLNRPGERAGE